MAILDERARGSASSGSDSRLLVLIVDASDEFGRSLGAQDPTQRLSITQCLDDVITFLNAYLLLSQRNSVAVCLCHQGGSDVVYPLPGQKELDPESELLRTGKYEPLVQMNAMLTAEVREVMATLTAHPPQEVASSSLLSGALSKSLCYIHRCVREAPIGVRVRARILVLRASKDAPSQYIATMSCIFAAQKNGVPVDSCVLWNDSGFLQQASDITGGVYIRVPEPAGILQFMLWTFLPDALQREHLSVPPPVQVDYRSACVCHHQLISTGYVCSSCLSIFCQFTPICSMCQTHFKLPKNMIPSRKARKRKQKDQLSTPGPLP